jgi:hypothetical protein
MLVFGKKYTLFYKERFTMKIYKKSLIIMSISFTGIVLGMLENHLPKECPNLNLSVVNGITHTSFQWYELWERLNAQMDQVEKESENLAAYVAQLIKSCTFDRQSLAPIAAWLITQRNNFPDKQWHVITNKLHSFVSTHDKCCCPCPTFRRFTAINTTIITIAGQMKPGEKNCLELLQQDIAKKLSDPSYTC